VPHLNRAFVFFVFISFSLKAQTPIKQVAERNQLWLGWMTSGKISDKISLWNNFHYVPETFLVLRTGVSYYVLPNFILTGGYAYLNLPTISDDIKLNRTEHRPWGQLLVNHKVSPKLHMINRVRYDMRYRQDFSDGRLDDSFTLTHRLRMLISMRWPLKGYEIKGGTPFINLSNELLVNFGKSVVLNHFDQNRLWLTFGIQIENFTFQAGYMHRYVQLASGTNFMLNHTAIIWLTHNFDLRKNKDADLFYRQP